MLKEKSVIIASITLAVLFVLYGVKEALPYLTGPEITITSPEDGSHVGTSTFVVSGSVKRAREVYLSGRAITIDQEGNFKETLVSYSPYTILTVEAVDRHGKRLLKTLTLTP